MDEDKLVRRPGKRMPARVAVRLRAIAAARPNSSGGERLFQA
jgi:hypothetical protein